MEQTVEKYVKKLLAEMVPKGEPNSSQWIARAVLADLLLAMWAKNPRGDTPMTVGGCIDIAEVTARADDPEFVFVYDSRLLRSLWFERARTNA